MLMMSRLQVPRLTSSSFAAKSSICQFERNGVRGFNSRNERWMNEHKSCRIRSAYMLAGEGAILAPGSVGFAQLHSLIRSPEDFEVGFAERKLRGPGCRSAAFDFIDPIEKFHGSSMVAVGGLFG